MTTIVAGRAAAGHLGHAGGMPADGRAQVTPPAPRQALRKNYWICLVCLGNICRSPMAEVVLRTELGRAGLAGRVEVDSAGTGDWHLGQPMDRRAAAELARRGLDGSGHRARQFLPSWFRRYDLVAAMDSGILEELRAMAPDQSAVQRTALFLSFDPARADAAADREVPDPYHRGAREYAHVFDLVQAAARGLTGQLPELLARLPAAPR
jgi:protein-tyrosine phosphatase